MKQVLSFLLLCVAVLTSGQVRAQPDYAALNRALTERIVIPGYERMAGAMAGLDTATAAFCAGPSADSLTAAEDAFHAAMHAWQRVQPIVFGPVSWDGRNARVQFWPDTTGATARQVRRALKAQDPALLAPGGLRGKSVALQSLATYERLVFGHGERVASGQGTAADLYACEFAAAIARFQAELSAQILEDWIMPGGFREAMLTAAEGNEHYAEAKEAAADFLKSLSSTLDLAIRRKLERPLGKTIETARGKRTESWRSERSRDNLLANLETARALYDLPGGFGDLLAAAGAEPLDQGLRKTFAGVIDATRSIAPPLHAAVADPAARPHVETLVKRLKGLRLLIGGAVAGEVGLIVGFNAHDGD